MLNIIDAILTLLAPVLMILYLLSFLKRVRNHVKISKCRVVLAAFLSVLFIIDITLSITLQKSAFSIGLNIFNVAIWGINAFLCFHHLKNITENIKIYSYDGNKKEYIDVEAVDVEKINEFSDDSNK